MLGYFWGFFSPGFAVRSELLTHCCGARSGYLGLIIIGIKPGFGGSGRWTWRAGRGRGKAQLFPRKKREFSAREFGISNMEGPRFQQDPLPQLPFLSSPRTPDFCFFFYFFFFLFPPEHPHPHHPPVSPFLPSPASTTNLIYFILF